MISTYLPLLSRVYLQMNPAAVRLGTARSTAARNPRGLLGVAFSQLLHAGRVLNMA